MNKIYLMDRGFLSQLLDDRKEIMATIKGWSAEEMRAEREALLDSVSVINVTPKTAEETRKSYTVDADGIATIPIVGELTPKASTDACGAYTAEALTEYGFIVGATEAAANDESVVAIDYYIDSPGGYHAGLMPAVNALRLVDKPTRAIVGDRAASAAYWLASQTDEIVALNESVRVGSIGVAVEEYDNTKALENAGITRRVYASTDAPLKRPDTSTEDGQAVIQDSLDDLHGIFRKQVAEGRGVSAEDVNRDFGKGGMLIAADALQAGMIDRIETVASRKQETISEVIGVEDNTAAKAGETKQGVKMDLNILKTEHSALFAEAVKIGVEQERSRVNELNAYTEADPENEKLAQVVSEAIAGGSSVSDINAKLQVAIRDGVKLDGENPAKVETVETKDALSDDDAAAAKAAGMSPEEYKKAMAFYGKGAK